MFGSHVRKVREGRRKGDGRFSLRQVSRRIGVEPAYLSKVERNEVAPPSEQKIRLLAREIGEDPDVLLAMAGKVSKDLQKIICRRPALFSSLIRSLEKSPDDEIALMAAGERRGMSEPKDGRGGEENA